MPPPLQSQFRPLCSFLYPSTYRKTLRKLHMRPTDRKCRKKSMMTQRMQRMNNAQFNNDVGLLGGTFIRPTGPRMPSLFSEPKRRLRMEFHWAWKKIENIAMLYQWKFLIKKRPRPRIARRKIGPLAQVKHREIYTALAEGDLSSIRQNCTDGILSSFRNRIDSRPKNELNRWILHKYVGWPRIVSTRLARLPLEHSAIIQVVVRLKSIQSLEKTNKGENGKQVPAASEPGGQQKKLLEYIVLQKMIMERIEKPWMVWGTVSESKVEDVIGEESTAGSPVMSKS